MLGQIMNMTELLNAVTMQAAVSTQGLVTMIVQCIEAVDVSTTLVGEERSVMVCGMVQKLYSETIHVLPYNDVAGEIAECVDALIQYYVAVQNLTQ